jgi:hypothetical protein
MLAVAESVQLCSKSGQGSRMRLKAATVLFGAASLGLCACTTPASVGRSAVKVRDGFGSAVTAPFEDLNIKRVEIPPVLVRARTNPYDLEGMTRCERIAAEVGSLDDALGPDMDEPPPPAGTRIDRAADGAANLTLDAVRDTSRDVIPFRGWVRRLSGAARHDKLVQAAIKAGTTRRAYLKGVGMRMNCSPPAAPSWFVPVEVKPEPVKPKPRPKPRRR